MITEITKLLTRGDKILIFGLIFLSVISLKLIKQDKKQATVARIKSGNELIAIYSLKKDTTFVIQGAISPMKIEIKKGKIRVLKSDCPAKICVKTGWIENTGQIIACVPNRIVITTGNGDKEDFLDVITQ